MFFFAFLTTLRNNIIPISAITNSPRHTAIRLVGGLVGAAAPVAGTGPGGVFVIFISGGGVDTSGVGAGGAAVGVVASGVDADDDGFGFFGINADAATVRIAGE